MRFILRHTHTHARTRSCKMITVERSNKAPQLSKYYYSAADCSPGNNFNYSIWLSKRVLPACDYSWSQLEPCVESRVTPATCQSSAPAPTLSVRPTFICTTATPAITLTGTVTTASARLMSSSASPCGEQVNQQPLMDSLDKRPIPLFLFLFFFNIQQRFFFPPGFCPRAGAKPAPGICFERVNSAGDPYGNCGKDSKGSFAKCDAR